MQNFRRDAKDVEKSVLEKYANRYFNFQAFIGSTFLVTAVAFSCCPIVTTTILPADAWYPFSVEALWTRILIYISQVLAIIQAALCVGVDLMIAAFFWHLSARLELLQYEFRKISTEMDLWKCIRIHQDMIELFDEVSEAVRYLIIKGTFTMTVTIVFSCFQLLCDAPLHVISKFILLMMCSCIRLYITSWAADDLKEQSEGVAKSIYESSWFNKTTKIQKSLSIVICRSQKPLIISATGIISVFSLKYYATFLATSLNYFFMLRAVFG